MHTIKKLFAPILFAVSVFLPLATTADAASYHIVSGDTYYVISKKLGIPITALEQSNPTMPANDLIIGALMNLPSTTTKIQNTSYTTADLYWLTRVIAAEATAEPFQAKLAVGSVVLNRVHSPYYANSIHGVIFQTIDGYPQFTCVATGWINQVVPTASDQLAALQVLSGIDVVPNAFVFYNPSKTATTSWVFTQPFVAKFGDFVFAS